MKGQYRFNKKYNLSAQINECPFSGRVCIFSAGIVEAWNILTGPRIRTSDVSKHWARTITGTTLSIVVLGSYLFGLRNVESMNMSLHLFIHNMACSLERSTLHHTLHCLQVSREKRACLTIYIFKLSSSHQYLATTSLDSRHL
jgi:hypothetical protein